MDVSLIIPYRDRAAFLPRTLRSVAQQRYGETEIILVDNGSQDASPDVAEAWAEEQRAEGVSVKLLTSPIGGAAAARNAGLQVATGEYVFFFDSDDEMSADFLVDAMAEAEGNDIVAAQTVMVFPNGRSKRRRVYRNASVADHILTGMLATQGMVLRRSFLVEQGGWNENLPKWNDWELGARLLCHNPRVRWLKGAYHRIYQHADSLTGVSLAATFPQILPALRAMEALPLNRAARAALAVRKAILAAVAPNCAGAEALRQEALATEPYIQYVYRYARRGYPGAWWIARQLSALCIPRE